MNKYQTPLTDELIHQYPEEVIEQLYDFINNVEFIKWLISPDRPYAKDCPHDSQGRVIVDLVLSINLSVVSLVITSIGLPLYNSYIVIE